MAQTDKPCLSSSGDPRNKVSIPTPFYRNHQLLTSGSLLLLSSTLIQTRSCAQSIDFIIPSFPAEPQQKPLPSREQPLQFPPSTIPLPEELEAIPQSITVKEFVFVGNTVLSKEVLNQATANFRGKPISFTQLLQAASQVTNVYIQEGYITSGAYIPTQQLDSGVVTIQIVEGSVANIEVEVVEGNLSPDYVKDRLELATNEPLNIRKLQEALQILQYNPLIKSLQAELLAGTEPGTNILKVNLVEADTFTLTPSINNSRNPSVGTFERRIQLTEANLFGRGDEINLAYSNTDGSDRFDFDYTIPVNALNGTVGIFSSFSNNEIVEPPFDELDIQIDSQEFGLTLSQPIFQRATPELTQEFILSLTAGRRNSDSRLLGVNFPVSTGANEEGETRISALRFSQEWLQRTRQSVFNARSQFSLGVNLFDATVNDDEPDSRFFAWRGQLIYNRLLGSENNEQIVNPSLLLRSDVQLSTTSLVPIEQLGLGGQASVRGYRQDALLSDNGIFLSAEVRLPIMQFPEVQGSLQVAPFVDFATGWNTEGDDLDPNTIASIGLGLIYQATNKFAARLDWGIPLIALDSERRTWQENGVYFQLEYNF
jgi:hemolysin activation/secretion protein